MYFTLKSTNARNMKETFDDLLCLCLRGIEGVETVYRADKLICAVLG